MARCSELQVLLLTANLNRQRYSRSNHHALVTNPNVIQRVAMIESIP